MSDLLDQPERKPEPDTTAASTSTDLIVPSALVPAVIFAKGGADDILKQLRDMVATVKTDISTPKGRAAVTLAFGEMLFYLFHDTKIGGGSDGMYIYFKPEITLGELTLLDLEDPRAFYYVTLACLVGATLLIRMLVSSPFGHALTAARENERRALSLGFPVFWIRLGAFIISASIAGLAGYFSAAQFGFVAPQLLGWHMSASVLVMVVLGGMSSVLGPIFGAIALLGLEEVLKAFFEHWKLIKGLIVIALVFALPGGLQQLAALLNPESGELDAEPEPVSVKEAAPHV
jgi:branched-chain amino acid transport system permease protein